MPYESSRFRLSQTMLYSLSKLLDPPNSQGNDWRLLAERLNVHRYVTFFATRPSPTESILCLWEARNRELLAISNLMNVLRGMGRFDAAAVLEQDLEIR
jgi:leucine-rich repeat transmembrane protein FLRT